MRIPTPSVLAVDLGGTSLRVALSDDSGAPITSAATPTGGATGITVVRKIARLAYKVRASAKASKLVAAAIGVPGIPDRQTGAILGSPNIAGLDAFDFRASLEALLGVPVTLDNDLNMATIGEGWRGCARGLDNYSFLAVGTGIGLGIVADGRVVRGSAGAAGEIAWLPLGVDAFAPAFHARGPLEEAVGGAGIVARYHERAASPALSGQEVFAAAERGDRAACGVLEEQARALALAVRTVQCMLDPELVALGGSIGTRADVVARTRAYLERLTTHPPVVEVSALGESAGLVGATRVALDLASTPGSANGHDHGKTDAVAAGD